MNVYTYFSPDGPDLDAQLVPIWEESWRRQGWNPRVLTIRDARKHPDFSNQAWTELMAFGAAGGGWYSKVNVINFSFAPRKRKFPLELFEGGVTWASKKGIKDFIQSFPHSFPNAKHAGQLVGNEFEIHFPLISFASCKSVEEAQQQIERCLQARKKN